MSSSTEGETVRICNAMGGSTPSSWSRPTSSAPEILLDGDRGSLPSTGSSRRTLTSTSVSPCGTGQQQQDQHPVGLTGRLRSLPNTENVKKSIPMIENQNLYLFHHVSGSLSSGEQSGGSHHQSSSLTPGQVGRSSSSSFRKSTIETLFSAEQHGCRITNFTSKTTDFLDLNFAFKFLQITDRLGSLS